MQTVRLPAVSHSILKVLVERVTRLSGPQIRLALETCSLLLSHTQPLNRHQQQSEPSTPEEETDLFDEQEEVNKTFSFFL